MSSAPEWQSRETALAIRLENGTRGPERPALLSALYAYADEILSAAQARGLVGASTLPPAEHWLWRPTFICGHHRSGTTLLQELLDGHPDLVVLPSEGTYFSSFAAVAGPSPPPAALAAFTREWVARLIDPNYPPHFKLGRSDAMRNPYVEFARGMFTWHAALAGIDPHLAEFRALLALVAAYKDGALPGIAPLRWVEKTPLNEHHAPRLLNFREARCIQVVRDPADSLASLLAALRSGGVASPRVAALANDIGTSLRLAVRNAARWPDRYMVVRYEDLTQQPAAQMERVRDFLGIRTHPALETPTSVGLPVRPNSSFVRGEPGVIRPAARAPARDAADRRLLAVFAGTAARLHGYDAGAAPFWDKLLQLARHGPEIALRRLRAALR